MTNIFIRNLDDSATEEQLRTAFSAYGEVGNVIIVKDRDTGQIRGFGFLEMPDQESAQAAIGSLHGLMLNGRSLRVNEARDKPDGSTDTPQLLDHRRHRF
jgi:RNA recognition motif-containing protein